MQNPFEIILTTLESIGKSIDELKNNFTESKNISYDILDVKEVAEYIKLSVPTIYGLVHKRKLPHYKKGKRLYFRKEEIDKWVYKGRIKTISELNEMAEEYIRKNPL